MVKKIFRSSLLTALLVLAAGLFFGIGILYQYFEKQLINELKSKAVYISYAVESSGADYIQGVSGSGERITLIAADGKVIADTEASAESMENHLQRQEVKQAIETGSGTSVRYSDTLTEKIIYYAVKMEDGNILRVSARQYTVATVLLGLVQPMAVILVLVVILSFVLSSRVAKSIVQPINRLDPENPEGDDIYEELSPLLKKISRQRKIIDDQLQSARQKQEEFRLITENMNEGFLVIDSEMNLLTYNASALRLLGISETVQGNVLTMNRSRAFRDTTEKALSGERSESEMSLDGRTCGLIANPVFEGRKVIGAVIVILDITERAKREQMRREFTANVSHELKTPLTSISGFAEMMKADGERLLTQVRGDVLENAANQDNGLGGYVETVIDFSGSIYDEAQRLITLVGDIIKISELDEKSVGLEKERVNLRELSIEITERLKPAAENKNIRISVIGSGEVEGVRKILDEMICNLCDNGIKYNKAGGLLDVIIASDSEKRTVTLTVRDTGIGIPKSAQSRVFERFYRVDKGRSKSMGGTGLGLAIVKHGAMYHDAEIRLESEENEGTEVSVAFRAV